jgi:xylulokinase
MKLLEGLGATASDVRITGGGAKSRFWVQMLADLFGAGCSTLQVDEGPAFGAAILAGVGIGVWPDVVSACQEIVRFSERIEPSGITYGEHYRRFRDLYAALKEWNRT